jgi:hypothetical protein
MLIANATGGLGTVDQNTYKCGGSPFACRPNSTATKTAFMFLQNQLNRVAAALRRPYSMVSVDGSIGSQTSAAVGDLGVPAKKMYPPPDKYVGMVLNQATPENVAAFADQLGAYFKSYADMIGAPSSTNAPASTSPKSPPPPPGATPSKTTNVAVGPTAQDSATALPPMPTASVGGGMSRTGWYILGALALAAAGGITWSLMRKKKGRRGSYGSRVSPRSA